jgi:hypothetical protein
MVLRAANGGKKRHGDMQDIDDKYKSPGHIIERSHPEYF